MKVALIGASGTGGSRLAAELSRRGHQVTAIARHPEKIAPSPGVTAMKGDVFDKAGLAQLLKGHDAVVSAVVSAQAILSCLSRRSGNRASGATSSSGAPAVSKSPPA
jgi:putative NADH-flavin reductase